MTRQRSDQPLCVLFAEETWGSTLHAMRSLDRLGAKVLVAVAGRGANVYRRSRYCAHAEDFDLSDSTRVVAEVIDWVERISPGSAPVLMIPLSDRTLELLDDSRSLFSTRFHLSIPGEGRTKPLLEKEASIQLADAAGLGVPTWAIASAGEEPADLSRFRFPVVVRPTSWRTSGTKYFKVLWCEDQSALGACLATVLEQGARVVIQDYVEGEVDFAIVWRSADGESTAVCTGRKRRQSGLHGGVMIWGETTHSDDVREAALQYLDTSGFVGLGGIEFVRSREGLQFIEFNPRLEAIHFLAAAASIDTVGLEYSSTMLGYVPAIPALPRPAAAWVGSAWLARLQDDRGYRRAAIQDRLDFSRSDVGVRAVDLSDDPSPALMILARIVGRGINKARRKVLPR